MIIHSLTIVTKTTTTTTTTTTKLRQVDAFVDFSCLVVFDILVHGEHAATGSRADDRRHGPG